MYKTNVNDKLEQESSGGSKICFLFFFKEALK